MVVIGYPGIGKSTISEEHENFIDYDSSKFYTKEVGWEELYVYEATKLSDQGFVVFISSHKGVQKQLKGYKGKVVVIYPSLLLHDFWINKLQDRYEASGDNSDHKALLRCVSHYCEDILELKDLPYKKIEITTEDYDLEELLKDA